MCEGVLLGRCLIPVVFLSSLPGCGSSYSPDTYAANAAQQANKAEQGIVVGVRRVAISASGTVGAVTGGAAGGVAGAQVGMGAISAFSAVGGTLLGGLAGTAMEHATNDTKAFEYIVRKTETKTTGELVSVTQKDTVPLAVGQRVLVIVGNQARVVPDYTIALPGAPEKPATATESDVKPATAKLAVDAATPVGARGSDPRSPTDATAANQISETY